MIINTDLHLHRQISVNTEMYGYRTKLRERDIMRKMCAVKQMGGWGWGGGEPLTQTDWVWPDQILHDNHQRQSRGQSVELRLKGKVLEWVLVQYTHYFVHLNCLCRLKAASSCIKHWTIGPSLSDSVTISFLTKYFHFLSVELTVLKKKKLYLDSSEVTFWLHVYIPWCSLLCRV